MTISIFSGIRRTALAVIAATLLYPPSSFAEGEPASANPLPEVKIGVIMPLTGALAETFPDAHHALQLIDEELRATPLKYRYRFIIEDGKCGGGNAPATIVQKMINIDRIKFLLLGCSAETLQAGPIAERAKVVSIAFGSNHKDVRELGDYIFRTYMDIDRGMARLAQSILDNGYKKIAILSEENAFCLGMKEQLIKYAGNENIAFIEDFPIDGGKNGALITKAEGKKPDVYYLNVASAGSFLTLYSDLRDAGIQTPVFGYFYPEHTSVLSALGAKLNNVRFISVPELRNAAPEFEAFRRRYAERFKEEPKVEFLMRTAYDAAFALINNIEEVGPDPVKVKDALYKYNRTGALGAVAFDRFGDIKDIDYRMKQIIEGKVVQLPLTGK